MIVKELQDKVEELSYQFNDKISAIDKKVTALAKHNKLTMISRNLRTASYSD